MAPIVDDLRIVRAAAGRVEIAAGVLAGAAAAVVDADAAAAVEADRAGIVAGVLGANFPLRSTHLHGRPRSIRASQGRRKDTSRRYSLGSLSRSSESAGQRTFRQRLRTRTRMMLKRRRAIRLLSISMNLLRMNPKCTETCPKMCMKMHAKDCRIR